MTVETQAPPPKNVREAYAHMKKTKDAASLCAGVTVFCGLLCAGLCVTIGFVALSIVHIYLLVVGAVNINNCPAERLIPIYLIVAAVFSILRAILNWYYTWCHPKIKNRQALNAVDATDQTPKPSPFSNIINLFLLIWLVCGAIWVFRTHPQMEHADQPYYCDRLTYWTAYIYVIVCLALMALSLIIGCCMCSCIVGSVLAGAGSTKTAENVVAIEGKKETV